MGNRAIENRIRKLKELEAQQAALEAQAEAIKAEIKAEMEAQEVEELHTGNFIVRWKTIISNKVDTTLLKKELPDVAARYTKVTTYKSFRVA